jgi:hypothetical protein
MRVRSSSALCRRLKCTRFACRWVLMPSAQLARGRVRVPATLSYQAMDVRPLRPSVGTKLHIAMGGQRTILNPEASASEENVKRFAPGVTARRAGCRACRNKGNAKGAKMNTKFKAWVAFGLFATTLQASSWKLPNAGNGWVSWIGIIASVPFALWLTNTVLEDDNKHR